MLSLYQLQAFYHNEIQRGYCGLGTYTLSPELMVARCSPDEICAIPTYSPEEIVSQIKEGVGLIPSTHTNADTSPVSASPSTTSESVITQTSRARLV